MVCPRCGQSNEAVARFCQSCGAELTSTKPVASASNYAGFWARFAAMIIDFVVIAAASAMFTAGTLGVGWFSAFVLPWIYEAVMLSSAKQATLGKMALGIAVTDVGGGRISFARATGRHFAKWVSGLLIGIGFLMAAFTEKKQALHDMMAETLVINRQAW